MALAMHTGKTLMQIAQNELVFKGRMLSDRTPVYGRVTSLLSRWGRHSYSIGQEAVNHVCIIFECSCIFGLYLELKF